MKKFFSVEGILHDSGLTLIRVIVGLFMIYHGWEVFDATKMKEYAAWDIFKQTAALSFMVYLGKASELWAGILLAPGLFTQVACLIIIGTMLYIAFFIGHGKIWYEDQYPILFAMLALVFFFSGAGKWSIVAVFRAKQQKRG